MCAQLMSRNWFVGVDAHVLVSRVAPNFDNSTETMEFKSIGIPTSVTNSPGAASDNVPGVKCLIKSKQYPRGVKLLWDLFVPTSCDDAKLRDEIQKLSSATAKSSMFMSYLFTSPLSRVASDLV